MTQKVVFIPGNCGGSPNDNWFPSVKKGLEAAGLAVVAEEFPDNELARKSFYHEYKDKGHFGGNYLKLEFPELSHAIISHLV